MAATLEREVPLAPVNPLGLEGIEFIEFVTARPQAFGHGLEALGFRPVARHRSREVMRYRQGDMNIVVNGHAPDPQAGDEARIGAIGLRVAHAADAWQRALDAGAWPVASQVRPMELLIPGVLGVGGSRVYLIDRWRDFSIYDVDFIPIPTVTQTVPATAGLHWFGVVQYVGTGRTADWTAFYRSIFGFTVQPATERAGILPAGTVLVSPGGHFAMQLVEPQTGAPQATECLQRVAFGAPDVAAVVQAWRARGIGFVDEPAGLRPSARGALTSPVAGGACFELVRHGAPATAP